MTRDVRGFRFPASPQALKLSYQSLKATLILLCHPQKTFLFAFHQKVHSLPFFLGPGH